MTAPLKYLFRVTHRDGRVVDQTPDDVSERHPGKSAWADVGLDSAVLLELKDLDGKVVFSQKADPPNERLRYHRRNKVVLGANAECFGREVIYRVGTSQMRDEELFEIC